MDPDTAAALDSFQPSDEALIHHVELVRQWEGGILPNLSFGVCALAWPRIREIVMAEWQQQLANPSGDIVRSGLPTLGWYIAAANRDADFFRPFLEGCRLEEDVSDALLGDIPLMDGTSLLALLASRSSEAIDLLEAAALPQLDIDPISNNLPLQAMAILVADKVIERERFDRLFLRCADTLSSPDFRDDMDTPERRSWLVHCLFDLGVGGFADEVRAWFDQNLMEASSQPIVTIEDLDDALCRENGDPVGYWRSKVQYDLIPNDAYSAMEWMMGGTSQGDEDDDFLDDESDLDALVSDYMDEAMQNALPQYRTEPKIGRNDPCPCASGKKFKKCCGKIA